MVRGVKPTVATKNSSAPGEATLPRRTMYKMLTRGNVASPGALEFFVATVGFTPRTIEETLSASPSHVQDRWHARLYLLAPFLRLTLAFLFIFSGIAGFLHPLAGSVLLLGDAGVPAVAAPTVIYLASTVDLLLGAILFSRYTRLAAYGMLYMLVAYTLFLGLRMPDLWFEPFGSLIKNIPLIPAVLIYLVLADRR